MRKLWNSRSASTSFSPHKARRLSPLFTAASALWTQLQFRLHSDDGNSAEVEGGDLGAAIWRRGQWMSADAARGNPMPDGQPWSRALQPFVTHPCQHDHLAGLMKPKVKPVTAEEPGTEPVHVFLARETPLPVPRVRRRLWNRLERKARDRCQPPGGILAQAAPRIVFPQCFDLARQGLEATEEDRVSKDCPPVHHQRDRRVRRQSSSGVSAASRLLRMPPTSCWIRAASPASTAFSRSG